MNYLMQYEHEHDFSRTVRYRVVTVSRELTGRELQQKFDPNYRYNYLKFFILGQELKII